MTRKLASTLAIESRLRAAVGLAAVLLLILGVAFADQTRGQEAGDQALPLVPRADWFGIAHVGYTNGTTPGDLGARYAHAQQAGAAWERWPIYWPNVETSAGSYDFSRVDSALARDEAAGFQVNAILMNTPAFFTTGGSTSVPAPHVGDKAASRAYSDAVAAGLDPTVSSATTTPAGLYQSVFADGTDTAAPGKVINAANPWARFVNTTVARYRGRVGLWEIWNEPDMAFFWNGSVADYARLLKVGYLAAKAADPGARVAVGGQAYWEWTITRGIPHAWLRAFLDQTSLDATAPANAYYFDVIPWHWYSRPSDILNKIADARSILAQRGIVGKPMLVNETNTPACGEPPVYAPCAPPTAYRGGATIDEQAAGVIQSAAYGLAAGLERLIFFQFADDGNGESYGLTRGAGSSDRPAYTAYQVAATYLSGAVKVTRKPAGDFERIIVETNQLASGGSPGHHWASIVWKRTAGDGTMTLPGTGAGQIVELDGSAMPIGASGAFGITLRGATDNRSQGGDPNDYIIGGAPRIIVASVPPPDLAPNTPPAATPVPTATPVFTPTPAPTATPAPTSGGLLRNGSFEAGYDCLPRTDDQLPGPTGWTCGGDTPARLSADAYRGSQTLLLGEGFVQNPFAPPGSDSNVSQSVTLPAGSRPFLQYTRRIITAEAAPANLVDYLTWPDRFDVLLTDSNGGSHELFAEWTGPTWRTQRLDLSEFAGSTVSITFSLHQSSADRPTVAYVDESQIWAFRTILPVEGRVGR